MLHVCRKYIFSLSVVVTFFTYLLPVKPAKGFVQYFWLKYYFKDRMRVLIFLQKNNYRKKKEKIIDVKFRYNLK